MVNSSIDQPALLPEWSAQLETKGGLKLNVRPAAPDDEAELVRFLGQATPEDLRFRFLSAVGKPGRPLAHYLIDVDHERTENLLAFDARDGRLAATAMVAADEKWRMRRSPLWFGTISRARAQVGPCLPIHATMRGSEGFGRFTR